MQQLLPIINFIDMDSSKKIFWLELMCDHCGYVKKFNSSPKSMNANFSNEIVKSAYDINKRAVIAFREVGCYYAAIKTFIFCKNTKSISENGFQK